MHAFEWVIATAIAIFGAMVGFFQYRTAQQKAAFDLFGERQAIYKIVCRTVRTMSSNSLMFDQRHEAQFLEAMERAYLFFGDDVQAYLEQMWNNITNVLAADGELKDEKDQQTRHTLLKTRRAALNHIAEFDLTGKPLFAKHMRFAQTVPTNLQRFFRRFMSPQELMAVISRRKTP
jgi:hypothetical protein